MYRAELYTYKTNQKSLFCWFIICAGLFWVDREERRKMKPRVILNNGLNPVFLTQAQSTYVALRIQPQYYAIGLDENSITMYIDRRVAQEKKDGSIKNLKIQPQLAYYCSLYFTPNQSQTQTLAGSVNNKEQNKTQVSKVVEPGPPIECVF